jgi:hypothetical protein
MLDHFSFLHLPVSAVGRSSYLIRVWCYSAQARESAAPSGQDAINRLPRVNPGLLCFHGPSGRRLETQLLPKLVS